MNKLVPISSPALPALVATAGEHASMRFLEFLAATIRNPHTRPAYGRAAEEFKKTNTWDRFPLRRRGLSAPWWAPGSPKAPDHYALGLRDNKPQEWHSR
jgi:hypothetical protein